MTKENNKLSINENSLNYQRINTEYRRDLDVSQSW
jgi:hypothetical protein